ncbi:MAG: DNA mismatch repair protein MutS [Acidobacteria bacterium]|uniref:DNA mismatch repair protein MutS n=1 Tax=Candidatus Polarisedimenticola svalbardensis TaxID=2886004 RepID=A0A8J6XWW8_9BACT|nr:DNA mismatch repair protein MutS [Candidatus Polarisedimenticola svalbardensis]
MAKDGPRSEYQARLTQRRQAAQDHDRHDRAVALARLMTAAAAVFLAFFAWRSEAVSWWWLALPAVVFLGLWIVHGRILEGRRRAERAVEFYFRGLGRIDDEWIGSGSRGDSFLNDDHPYAADLDLFGDGSLFQLLSLARTRSGEETLASWLCAPSAPGVIRGRQEAVDKLKGNLDLREDLSILGEEVDVAIHPSSMKDWGVAPPILNRLWLRYVAIGSGLLSLLALIGWMFFSTGPWPSLVLWTLQSILALVLRRGVRQVTGSLEDPERDLELLSRILTRLEEEQFQGGRLGELSASLETGGVPPSRAIRRLARLTDLLNAMHNQLFAPFGLLLMWTTQFAFAIEEWRQNYGGEISGWLDAVGEFEALSSLAGYAYEHPVDPFPEIVEDRFLVDGVDLGHPLLSAARCIRNDVRLDSSLKLLVVSGSNMSGKSTLLRTLGVNVVLALAGAPVRARSLKLSPVAVGATLRIQDSLQEGSSRFYAEITRLRQIMERTGGELPVLFLIDEILAGTNSHDRAIGAAGLIRGLLDRSAAGLVTTHDLALAKLADDLGDLAANVHFEDHLSDGMMEFDYRLRPGVVRKSNALELMRSIGLDV